MPRCVHAHTLVHNDKTLNTATSTQCNIGNDSVQVFDASLYRQIHIYALVGIEIGSRDMRGVDAKTFWIIFSQFVCFADPPPITATTAADTEETWKNRYRLILAHTITANTAYAGVCISTFASLCCLSAASVLYNFIKIKKMKNEKRSKRRRNNFTRVNTF